jgi:hypothetical protein
MSEQRPSSSVDGEPEAATPTSELTRERARRRQAEARAADLTLQLQQSRTELSSRLGSARYQIGDAIVRACRPSAGSLLLPFRLLRLGLWGARRALSRRGQSRSLTAPTHGVTQELQFLLDDPLPSHVPSTPFDPIPREFVSRPNLEIAVVADEISWRSWQYEAHCSALTIGNWKAVLASRAPDLLWVESCWNGPKGSWGRELTDLPGRLPWPATALDEILGWCRRRDIPTVFYNKEDPFHFNTFLEAASRFDWVFTTDVESVEAYRAGLGHQRVDVLPFGVQPRLQNPLQEQPGRLWNVCFAGAWYREGLAARQRAAQALLAPARAYGLHIYDRVGGVGNPRHQWPEEYGKMIVGSLPYVRMLRANRCYRVGLNLNSVSQSRTMLSRRVFELLASGTPVVSSVSRAIPELFGEDLVLVSATEDETRRHIEKLLGDETGWASVSNRGVRRTMMEHTCSQRLNFVLDKLGVSGSLAVHPRVDVLAPVFDGASARAARVQFERQSYGLKGRLLLCSRAGSERGLDDAVDTELLCAESRPGASWGGVLSDAVRRAEGEWIALLHPNHHYGPAYLTDAAVATLFSPHAAIARLEHYVLDERGGVCRKAASSAVEIPPWTLMLQSRLARQVFSRLEDAESLSEWARRLVASLDDVHSAGPWNYVRGEELLERSNLLDEQALGRSAAFRAMNV